MNYATSGKRRTEAISSKRGKTPAASTGKDVTGGKRKQAQEKIKPTAIPTSLAKKTATTVEALVSDHLGNSEKWSQLELVAYENGLS